MSESQDIWRRQGEGVSGRRFPGRNWSGRRHDAGHWKESAGTCGSVAWHTYQSLELSGPGFRWFHVCISKTESWGLVSHGAKIA